METTTLRHERGKLINEANNIMKDAVEKVRALTVDEETRFDNLMVEADKLQTTIDRVEKAREAERKLDSPVVVTPQKGGDPQPADDPEKLRSDAFRQFLVNGRSALSPEQARALVAGTDPDGGYLVAPQQFIAELIKNLDDDVIIRQFATTHTVTTSESLGVPTLDTDLNDSEWTTELATGSQDDALQFGNRELRPNPVSKRVKISRKLLRAAAIGPEALVRERLAYKFAVTEEKAFMTGDGNKKPLGLFTASDDGIGTGRDKVVADDSDNAFIANGLIDAKYFLKAKYYPNARWLFHRDAIRDIRKLRDDAGGAGVGNFLWQPGLAADRPDRILDIPYVISEFVPNAVTAGSYVGMLGDFRHYWIADALTLEIQRLVELYAETNQVGFIGRLETDGMPVLQEAFVRLSVQA